ncbi:hypothetical protein ES708_00227 [subsurface metagenome]
MAEKALTTYDDGIMDAIPKVLMVMFGVMLLFALSPITAYAQAQTYAQAYQGLTNTLVLNATPTTQWVNLINDPPYSPLITASFYNDGPNSVFIAINNPDEFLELNEGDSRVVSMSGGERRIEFIFYKCNPGERASVRVDGKY